MPLKLEVECPVSANEHLYSLAKGGRYELATFGVPGAARYSMVPAVAADNAILVAVLHLLMKRPCVLVVVIAHQGGGALEKTRRRRVVEASAKSRGWTVLSGSEGGDTSVFSKRAVHDQLTWPLKAALLGAPPRLLLRGIEPEHLGRSRLDGILFGPHVAPTAETIEFLALHDAQIIYPVRDDFGRAGAVLVGAKLDVDPETVAGVELLSDGRVGSVWRLGPWDGR